jgi:hypothetical protein
MRRLLWIFPALMLTAVGLGAWNVFADSAPVEAMARATACAGEGTKCSARQDGYYTKTPAFLDLALRTSSGRHLDVRCMRAYVFIGDYACTVKPSQSATR